jgi:anti-sigma factor RsiW
MAPSVVRCVDLVETVTDWMEGALDDRDRRLLEEHLATCAHCNEYVSELRATSAVLARVTVGGRDAPRATARAALLDAFRAASGH